MKYYVRISIVLGILMILAYFICFFYPLSSQLFGYEYEMFLIYRNPYLSLCWIPGTIVLALPYFIYPWSKSAFPLSKKNKKSKGASLPSTIEDSEEALPAKAERGSYPQETTLGASFPTPVGQVSVAVTPSPIGNSAAIIAPATQEATPKIFVGESDFDGKLHQLIGLNIKVFLQVLFTLGIGLPWALCKEERWICKHTTINGQRLVFDGRESQLIGSWIKWSLLSLITFGIYSFWVPLKLMQWKTKHTSFKSVSSPKEEKKKIDKAKKKDKKDEPMIEAKATIDEQKTIEAKATIDEEKPVLEEPRLNLSEDLNASQEEVPVREETNEKTEVIDAKEESKDAVDEANIKQ